MKSKIKLILIIVSFLLLFITLYSFIRPFKSYIKVSNGDTNGYIRVDSSNEFVQDIKIESDYVVGINIIPYYNSRSTIIEYKIYDDKNKLIYYNELDALYTTNGNSFLFKTPAINKSGKIYKLHINVLNEGDRIYLKKLNDSNIVFNQIISQNNYKPCYLFLFMFVIFTIIFFCKFNMNIRTSKKTLKIFTIIIYYLLNILFAYNLLFILYRGSQDNINVFSVCLELILAILISFLGVYKFKNNKKDLAIIFLIISIPILSLYCALFKPGDGQDEYRHYARAYMIATNQKSDSVGLVEVPSIITVGKLNNNKDLFEKLKQEYSYNDLQKVDYAHYNPVNYMGPSIIIWLCKKAGINPYIGWISSKIFNYTFSIAIGFLLIKYIKKFKILLLTYLLIPMNIYQMVSLSSDTVINLSFLTLFTISLNKYFDSSSLTWYEYILFVFCSYLTYISKVVYIPLIFLSVYLMRKSLKNKKDIIIIILCILLVFSSKFIGMIFNNKILSVTVKDFIFTDNHIKMTLLHPFNTLYVFLNFIFKSSDIYLLDFIGIGFNWSQSYVPDIFAILYLLILIYSSFISHNDNKFKLIDIFVLIFVFFLVFALITVGMYAVEIRSDVLLNILWGVQGRYFYPIYILLFVILSNCNGLIIKNQNNYFKVIILILIVQSFYINYFIQFFM